jgi:hypothetical protein
VALLDLTGDGVSAAESEAVTNLLMSAAYDTGLVDVIDRSTREELLSEIEFSLADCTDETCAIEAGKLLAADVMVIGGVHRIGSRIAVDLKAVEVASSRIVGTFYRLYESIDAIVDGVKEIATLLIEDFTGKIAQRKEVLRYEQLVRLVVASEVEGAMVYLDGASVGQITEGKLTKAVNKDAEITLRMEKDGYYPRSQRVRMDGDQTVTVSLDRLYLHRIVLDARFGGGAMGALRVTLAPRPNWWEVGLGVGFTVTSTDPVLVNLPVSLSTHWYLFVDDRSRLRPYAGIGVLANLLKISEGAGLVSNPVVWHAINLGLEAGLELKLTEWLRLAAEVDVYINQFFFDMTHVLQVGLGTRVKL